MPNGRRRSITVEEARTRADRARRILLAGTLVLGPALLALSDFIAPSVDWSDKSDIVRAATEDTSQWQAYNLLGLAGMILLVPGIIAAAELVRARFPRQALAITALVGVGVMLVAGAIFSELQLAGARGVSQPAMGQYLDQAEDLGAMGVLLPFFFAPFVGYLWLAATLWRSKATSVSVPILLTAGILIMFPTDDTTIRAVGELVFAAAMFGVARAFWTGKEEPTPAVLPRLVHKAA